MADRQTRRTLKRTVRTASGSVVNDEQLSVANGEPTDSVPITIGDDGGIEPVDDGTVDEPANEPESDGGIGTVEIDPAELSEFIASGGDSHRSDASGDEPRKRRKRGPNKRTATRNPADITGVIKMVHTYGAILLKMPELNLEDSEIEALNKAYKEFSKYHEIPMLDDKRLSEVNMVVALLSVYGTRAFAMFRNRKTKGPRMVVMQPPAQGVN